MLYQSEQRLVLTDGGAAGGGAAAATTKRYRLGTHRIRTPEETWAWIEGRLPRAGITRVADVTGLDVLGIPVFQAIRPASRNLAVSQGKGATAAAARVGAVMEALEIWHAERLDDLPQCVESLAAMRSANPIPLESLRWEPGERPSESARLAWIRAEPLLDGRTGWLPRQMLELDFRLPRSFEPAFFLRTSNGLASGNCREEALLHALCELVERHGLARFQENRTGSVALDLDAVSAAPCAEWIARIRSRGMKLAVWDATWDAGLPTLVAELVAPDLPQVFRGSGCHLSPDVALSRALSEAAQSRLTYISGVRDDLLYPDDADLPADRIFARFVAPAGRRRLEWLPDLATDRVESDLACVLSILDRLGAAPYAVDLTCADLGIPVTAVFAPGLREPPEI